MLVRLICLGLVFLVNACSFNKPTNETPYVASDVALITEQPGILKRRILLIGDAGHSSLSPLQASLQKAVERASISPENTSIIMLGDNIYYFGFPEKDEGQEAYSKSQQEDISHLEAQLQIAKLSGAEIFVVPGNHDWYAKQVDSQAQYIEDYAQQHNISAQFGPHQLGTDPLPEIIHREGVSIVLLDSMWLITTSDDAFARAMKHLDQLLQQTSKQYPDNVILITAHHPIETMGAHNLYYTSMAYQAVIATLELFMENDQDTDHPRYQRLIQGLQSTLERYDKVVYAAGHDHNLQVFKDKKGHSPQYRLVSGAGNTSKITGVGTNENTEFALAQEGLMELDVLENGVILRVYDIHNNEAVHQQWLWQNK